MSNLGAYLKTRAIQKHHSIGYRFRYRRGIDRLFSLGYYTRHGEGIPVPKLKGQNIDRAMATLKEQGFNIKIDSVYVPDEAPGTVVEQDPDAGTNVKEGRTYT